VPGGAPRAAAAAGRRPVFLFFRRECRILVRAHGSVAPGSSCPGGDLHPFRGAACPVQPQIKAYRSFTGRHPIPFLWFSPAARYGSIGQPFRLELAVSQRIAALGQSGGHRCSADTVAAIGPWRRGPSWRRHFGPFARRHRHRQLRKRSSFTSHGPIHYLLPGGSSVSSISGGAERAISSRIFSTRRICGLSPVSRKSACAPSSSLTICSRSAPFDTHKSRA